MNYNFLFTSKATKILELYKDKLPLPVYNLYKEEKIVYKHNFKGFKDVIKELKCFEHVLTNIDWKVNTQISINKNDLYLHRGYIPRRFSDEIKLNNMEKKDIQKIISLSKLDVKEIFSLSPPIVINLKLSGFNIFDGYHRIIAGLIKNENIEFRCILGRYKHE